MNQVLWLPQAIDKLNELVPSRTKRVEITADMDEQASYHDVTMITYWDVEQYVNGETEWWK